MANNRTCCTCGKKYEYCPTCKKDLYKSSSALYCSEDCKKIMIACSDFSAGTITKSEALDILNKANYKNKKFVSDSLKDIIKKITANNAGNVGAVNKVNTVEVKAEDNALKVNIETVEPTKEVNTENTNNNVPKNSYRANMNKKNFWNKNNKNKKENNE